MPDQLAPAPQLRSWTRQGIDVSALMGAALDAVAAAGRAQSAAVAAQAAADQAIAIVGGIVGGSTGNVYPASIIGITQVGINLLIAPGSTYADQQQSARTVLGVPKLGAAATDAAPGTLSAAVAALTARVTTLESGGTGTGKDNINLDTDGVPYWID